LNESSIVRRCPFENASARVPFSLVSKLVMQAFNELETPFFPQLLLRAFRTFTVIVIQFVFRTRAMIRFPQEAVKCAARVIVESRDRPCGVDAYTKRAFEACARTRLG
jgi:hypothetical protein